MGLKDRARQKVAKTKPKTAVAKYASVKLQTFQVAELEDAPYNARTITAEALKGLAASIDQFGLASLPVVNVAGGKKRIVGGHQRRKVLQEEGVTEVECIVVEFDDATEQRANLALNNPHIQGEFVPELTRELLHELQALDDSRFRSLRFDTLFKQVTRDLHHVAGVDDVVAKGQTGDDDFPTLGKAAAVSALGQFYRLGEHVILCDRLVAPGSLLGFPVDAADAAFCQFIGKNLEADATLDVYLEHVLRNTVGAIHLACEDERHVAVQRRFVALGGHYSSTIVAYHPSAKGRATAHYKPVTIPVLYGWPQGSARPWYGDANQGNVWPLHPPLPVNDLPVEVAVRAIRNVTKAGDVVLDVDVRKGASVIAAEKTKRRLIGYCAHPREMDAIRARWAHFVHGPDANWQAVTEEV